jgi:hypothetical protein
LRGDFRKYKRCNSVGGGGTWSLYGYSFSLNNSKTVKLHHVAEQQQCGILSLTLVQ